ncbi:hypothetical protein JHK82_018532 [Glycine max]|uniref:Uncharacterized protein n=1 Tax=Glycine max TaxID=3847 RepID=K7L1N0_SOYBN|nr:hypothetical protein JHK86_018561 [Glycine max]KAG5142837.1 hypothetical protein JHK82_018532 [Glycine max]KAH1086825.1 hypothetical protein GYH30_018378 [Glycine max]KRH49243.1 hypothetical protein GLYMA_07G142200v4 [Glycine max]
MSTNTCLDSRLKKTKASNQTLKSSLSLSLSLSPFISSCSCIARVSTERPWSFYHQRKASTSATKCEARRLKYSEG